MNERTSGVYIDGKPIADVDFRQISEIDVVDIVGQDTKLNVLPGAEVKIESVKGLRSFVAVDMSPAPENANFIPPALVNHPIHIKTVTGTGSFVLQRLS